MRRVPNILPLVVILSACQLEDSADLDDDDVDEIGQGNEIDEDDADVEISTQPVTGKAYYLSPTGNDSNLGTKSGPWKSLRKLVAVQSMLRPGDTVYFRGGDYVISDATTNSPNMLTADGTASAPITYRNYPNERPVLVYDKIATAANVAVLYPYGDYTTFEGLSFIQTEASRRVATDNNDTYLKRTLVRAFLIWGRHVTIRNCTIENFSGIGLSTPGSNVLVEHNTIKGGANHNLYLQGANGVFRYNYLDGTRQINGGRNVQMQYKDTDHNQVYGNLMINGSADSVVFSGQISYNEVFNNVIINPGSGRYSGLAVGVWCEDGPMGPGNKFYNNTVIGSTAMALLDDTVISKCLGQRPLARIEIFNNIFHPKTPTPIGISGSHPSVHDNIFYNVTGSIPPGNRHVDPMLTNPSALEAAGAVIKANSPAIDRAAAGAPFFDYTKKSRPVGAADIGAFEFSANAASVPMPPPRAALQ